MRRLNVAVMACPAIAGVMLSTAQCVRAAEQAQYIEHELLKITDPLVTFVRRTPIGEGDGKISVEVVAQINPGTELTKQPGGWWYYLEFQGDGGRYLTGAYKGPKLAAEPKTFSGLSSYIPAGTRQMRIGIGAKGKTYQRVTSLRVIHHRPAVALQSPADGASIADNTPRFEWQSPAQRVVVEISRDTAFSKGDTMQIPVQLASESELKQALAPGAWYWRVTSLDGSASAARRFVQTAPADADTAGPTLEVEVRITTCDYVSLT